MRATDLNGKRKEINLGTSDKKEARLRAKKEIDLLNSQLDGSFAKVMAIPEMVEEYYRAKTNLMPSTRERNKQHTRYFLLFMRTYHPEVKYFNQIHQGHIEEFQEYRSNQISPRKKKASPKTVKESVGIINNMFEWGPSEAKSESRPRPLKKSLSPF